MLIELTAIASDCANGPRNVCSVGGFIFVNRPIAIFTKSRATDAGAVRNPPIDVVSWEVRMTEIVSCIDNTYFHMLFRRDGPKGADIDRVDAPRCGLILLRLDAAAV
jgi:hypothetical protein